jgi:hypothetical protein
LLAHHATGVTLSSFGQHAAALGELDQAIKLYDREKHAALAYVYGQDSGVVCRSQAAFCLWFVGLPEQALKRNEEALALARELSHPYSLAAALDFSSWIHQLVQDRSALWPSAQASQLLPKPDAPVTSKLRRSASQSQAASLRNSARSNPRGV